MSSLHFCGKDYLYPKLAKLVIAYYLFIFFQYCLYTILLHHTKQASPLISSRLSNYKHQSRFPFYELTGHLYRSIDYLSASIGKGNIFFPLLVCCASSINIENAVRLHAQNRKDVCIPQFSLYWDTRETFLFIYCLIVWQTEKSGQQNFMSRKISQIRTKKELVRVLCSSRRRPQVSTALDSNRQFLPTFGQCPMIFCYIGLLYSFVLSE